jgi:hypothetical protein
MMTRGNRPALIELITIARDLPTADVDLYREMTGLNLNPETVAAQLFLSGGPAWGFYKGGRALAAGGYTSRGNGTWVSWFMATGEAWMHPNGRELTELVRQTVAEMFRDPYVMRLETVTLASREKARAWYERIGLTYESTACKASASAQDLVTYVAVRT